LQHREGDDPPRRRRRGLPPLARLHRHRPGPAVRPQRRVTRPAAIPRERPEDSTMIPQRPRVVPALGLALVALLAPAAAEAETCLSPYVRRLDRPEKYLYVFCVDADAQDNDFVVTIDVDRTSPEFGRIIHRLDLGSKGNETHHWGFTDDRTRIWAGGLFSSRIWIIDVATDPASPRVETVLDDVSAKTGLSGPHTYYALPGRMLVSFLGAADGGLPAGLAEFTNDGQFIRRLDQPEE